MTENLLVSTDWLAAHLTDANLRIIDIRGHVLPADKPTPHYFNHQADYDLSHIPGAVFIDWVEQITDPADPRHAQIAKPERYSAVMSQAGIDENTFVVAYDDASGMFAARLWWSLNYYGHTKAAVLDGGWTKWAAEKRPVTTEVPAITPKTFLAKPNPAIYRTSADVEAALGSPTKLMDVRTPEEFKGEYARAKRAGHIPGAVNQPRGGLVNADGTMLPPEQLKVKLGAIGIDDSTPEVIVYCNGGVSASFGLLAMRVAGLENGAVYDGSWKDWGNDEQKPIER
ncbi:MAG: sulfurtransferase [Chloroflexi bacterium]|nr:sulfurtransferase [Chloroflexota bacterium]MCC6893738.1 sulfurtransferase [Anaerolineae bacterium]